MTEFTLASSPAVETTALPTPPRSTRKPRVSKVSTNAVTPSAPEILLAKSSPFAADLSKPEPAARSGGMFASYTADAMKASWYVWLQRMMDAGANLRNASIGALLVFLSHLPIFLEPVLFVMTNIRMLGRAMLHVVGPLALAWYAAQTSPLLRETLFSMDGFTFKFLGAACLFVFSCLSWMFGWLMVRHLFGGFSSTVQRFADVGASNHAVQ
jgi:hypothetical protein